MHWRYYKCKRHCIKTLMFNTSLFKLIMLGNINTIKRQSLDRSERFVKTQTGAKELWAEVLDTLINVAKKQLNISIRKKPGTQQPKGIKKIKPFVSVQRICRMLGYSPQAYQILKNCIKFFFTCIFSFQI